MYHEVAHRLMHHPGGGGDYLNNSVVHMREQRNTNKGWFSEAKRKSGLGLGVKRLFLRKRAFLDSIWGILFSNFIKHVLQKCLFTGKCGGKLVEILV